ncbi:acyl-CoA carboxylase epsilon subunit [Actinoplanes regularis]|uniref:Acyl-CoA carboxylase epsilon subunit n=1 Tax=Actinoplanes regularis TaxID=52697 RepID=A0A239JEF9_9ACTN|nr:acyl-CoA carboxylase epsilon subunit [Actinoplanes regularis]GIE91824.1 hypothetical protein Are01nite_83040 [Actinoplanes regularis]SNT03992.1 Acyl-CoA carboxylase epsilon subunit [Actinoplanes regularis]
MSMPQSSDDVVLRLGAGALSDEEIAAVTVTLLATAGRKGQAPAVRPASRCSWRGPATGGRFRCRCGRGWH